MVKVISPTIQEFGGVRYYRCGYYFQRHGKRLHRVVWESINGSVPVGHHVHHCDGDRANNLPSNLELLPGRNHLSLHMLDPDRVARSRETIKIAAERARRWHGSPEGIEWHRQQYEKHCRVALRKSHAKRKR